MAQMRSPRATAPVSGNSKDPVFSVFQQPSRESFSNGVAVAKSRGLRSEKPKPGSPAPFQGDRRQIAQPWQREVYRHVEICGEARYAATLFSQIAGRAEIGVSEAQTLARKAVWVTEGDEVDAFAEIAPTVRDRSRLIRKYMLHRVLVGECYLISRPRVPGDPLYVAPPTEEEIAEIDLFDEDAEIPEQPDNVIWEIVAVTEIERTGSGSQAKWRVRHENGQYIDLRDQDAVIRMWDADPENRLEAWSPFKSLLPTLNEIEWLTRHIFAQVSSRLAGAGVWFLPNNLTYPAPPDGALSEEQIAKMNDAEMLMAAIASASMEQLDADEPSLPTIIMADPEALEAINKEKLIQFWSEIDEKAMVLRSDAVRRFALGMDLPPEQVLGSSGLAVTGAGGSAGSVNHWGVWANEEQTISAHVEPALDDFTHTLTTAVLLPACPGTDKVIAYDTASLRLRQDRSKESIELYDRGLLKGEVALRENGFDPDLDKMDDVERKMWLLHRLTAATPDPTMLHAALKIMGLDLPAPEGRENSDVGGLSGEGQPRNLDSHPQEGPPQGDQAHHDAPFSAFHASCEGMVLRALEKAGNRLLNANLRGKDKDRVTPPHLAHVTAVFSDDASDPVFDFSMLHVTLADLPAKERDAVRRRLDLFCASLYRKSEPYTREALVAALEGL